MGTKGLQVPLYAPHPRDEPCPSLLGSPGLASRGCRPAPQDPWLAASQWEEGPQVCGVGCR